MLDDGLIYAETRCTLSLNNWQCLCCHRRFMDDFHVLNSVITNILSSFLGSLCHRDGHVKSVRILLTKRNFEIIKKWKNHIV